MTGRSSMAIRNRALLGLMLDTGIRQAEVCNLTLRDVDFEQSPCASPARATSSASSPSAPM